MAADEHSRWGKAAARTLEALVLIAVVALVWSNYALRKRLKTPAFGSTAEVRAFAVGERLTRVPVTQPGRPNQVLDFTHRRALVAVVNPSCGTCQSIVEAAASNRSLEPVFFTARESAAELVRRAAPLGLSDRIFALDPSLPRPFQDRFVINPQIFIVDRGKVVRTCDNVPECADRAR
ncbi:MAG TPA: hypothetical protein VF432_04795 [Thermoanaerobaculia bacterium]